MKTQKKYALSRISIQKDADDYAEETMLWAGGSILGFFLLGFCGIPFGLAGLLTANKGLALFRSEPYFRESFEYSIIKIFRIVSLIGLVVGIVMFAAFLVSILYHGPIPFPFFTETSRDN